jgi:hypothetical protein
MSRKPPQETPQDAELIDFLLGELPVDRAAALDERLAAEPEFAREAARYADALTVLRAAAREEAWAPARRTRRVLQGAAAVAAVLLVAVGILWFGDRGSAPARVFEPDAVYGALFPEELGPDGGAIPRGSDDGFRVVRGAVSSGAIGARSRFPLEPGDAVPANVELACGIEQGALVSLPRGGLLFLGPLARVQLRPRPDGRAALRLEAGVAATVAGSEPIHVALDATDLLLTQHAGAALLRKSESDVLCLRGRLELHLASGGRWRIPVGHVLPAACAQEPESAPFSAQRIELDWYDALYDRRADRTTIELSPDGRSEPLDAPGDALLYASFATRAAGEVTVRFIDGEGVDGEGRTFRTAPDGTLEIRVPLRSLGDGPVLEIRPPEAVRQVRLLELR